MTGPLYPNVPSADGVPPVNRGPDNPADDGTVPLLTSDSADVTQQSAQQWGVYDQSGNLALSPDTIASFSYDAEYRLADYPIEQGGFQTYDKVALPFETTVKMMKGGTLADRTTFAATIETMRKDTNLYSVVTPEATYMNVNMSKVSIDRSNDSGAGMIIALIHLREIRETATQAFSSTQKPSGAAQSNSGSVQTAAPSGTTSSTLPQGPLNANGTVYY